MLEAVREIIAEGIVLGVEDLIVNGLVGSAVLLKLGQEDLLLAAVGVEIGDVDIEHLAVFVTRGDL